MNNTDLHEFGSWAPGFGTTTRLVLQTSRSSVPPTSRIHSSMARFAPPPQVIQKQTDMSRACLGTSQCKTSSKASGVLKP